MRNGKDPVGEEMKTLERSRWHIQAAPQECMYVRIDGKSFSRWTKKVGMDFADIDMLFAMAYAMSMTAHAMGADVAYCQSDEASIGWFNYKDSETRSQHIFDGKPQKVNSVAVSTFTAHFLWSVLDRVGTETNIPSFDSRFVNMPSMSSLQRMFYWRWLDCKRNAIQGFGQQKYSQKEMNKLPLRDLYQKLINDGHEAEFLELPESYRHGSFYINRKHLDPMMEQYPNMTARERFIETFRINA